MTERIRPGDRIIDVRHESLKHASNSAYTPGDYIKKRSGDGWWFVEEDGSLRNVEGALVFALDEKWGKEHKEE